MAAFLIGERLWYCLLAVRPRSVGWLVSFKLSCITHNARRVFNSCPYLPTVKYPRPVSPNKYSLTENSYYGCTFFSCYTQHTHTHNAHAHRHTHHTHTHTHNTHIKTKQNKLFPQNLHSDPSKGSLACICCLSHAPSLTLSRVEESKLKCIQPSDPSEDKITDPSLASCQAGVKRGHSPSLESVPRGQIRTLVR